MIKTIKIASIFLIVVFCFAYLIYKNLKQQQDVTDLVISRKPIVFKHTLLFPANCTYKLTGWPAETNHNDDYYPAHENLNVFSAEILTVDSKKTIIPSNLYESNNSRELTILNFFVPRGEFEFRLPEYGMPTSASITFNSDFNCTYIF